MEACGDSCASPLGQCRCLHRKRIQEFRLRSWVLLLSEVEPIFPWHRLFSCEVNCIVKWQEHPGVNQIRMHNIQISFGEKDWWRKRFFLLSYELSCARNCWSEVFVQIHSVAVLAVSQDAQGTSRVKINERTTGNLHRGGSLLGAVVLLEHVPCGMHVYRRPWWQS